jgi:HEAT repeat protein
VRYSSLLIFSLVVVSSGCGTSPPAVSGGKPVEHWLTAIRDSDPKVRVEAVRKLGNIGRKDSAALPAAFGALTDPDPAVRKEAIYAVVRNRNSSGPALPILARMRTEDTDPAIRQLAGESYGNLTQ